MAIGAQPSRRLAEYRDVPIVAAEAKNILPHPFEGKLLIHQPVVAARMPFTVDCRMREKSEQAESIIDRDHNYIAVLDQGGGVEQIATFGREAAAVNPDHHREKLTAFVPSVRSIDVQEKTILAAGDRTAAVLRAYVAELGRLKDSRPSAVRLGRHPSKVPNWRRSVRDAEILIHLVSDYPSQRPAFSENILHFGSVISSGAAAACERRAKHRCCYQA
jgi:hypothetical protein